MFEARLTQGGLLKKLLDAVKDLVTDGNFDCSSTGFGLQAMDTSHVSLVSMMLRSDGFDHYRCDRNISMGMNLVNMAKMLKCANDKDIVTMKVGRLWSARGESRCFPARCLNLRAADAGRHAAAACSSEALKGKACVCGSGAGAHARARAQAEDQGDTITFMFESENQERISDFELKLMDIDSEQLGIPDTEYTATVRMPAQEFQRICKCAPGARLVPTSCAPHACARPQRRRCLKRERSAAGPLCALCTTCARPA